jgi:hypothetical protein
MILLCVFLCVSCRRVAKKTKRSRTFSVFQYRIEVPEISRPQTVCLLQSILKSVVLNTKFEFLFGMTVLLFSITF